MKMKNKLNELQQRANKLDRDELALKCEMPVTVIKVIMRHGFGNMTGRNILIIDKACSELEGK